MSSRPDHSLNFTRELRSRAASGASGAELARWLQQQLGPRFTVILFHWNFLHAFGIPLETLRRSAEDWVGLGPLVPSPTPTSIAYSARGFTRSALIAQKGGPKRHAIRLEKWSILPSTLRASSGPPACRTNRPASGPRRIFPW